MILQEFHVVPYAGHPGYHKTLTTIKNEYFWPGLKKEVVYFISKCLEFQRVKVEHKHPVGLLQPLAIPEWKWDTITIEFITNIPRSSRHNDSIMVVDEKLTKATHFILVKSTFKESNIAEIYMKEIA